MSGQTPEEFRERGFLVLGSRLDSLYAAIRGRDWETVEFKFDRVRSQASKLSGERGRAYDSGAGRPVPSAGGIGDPGAQVEAVLDVLAPKPDLPAGFVYAAGIEDLRIPRILVDWDGQAVRPDDAMLRTIAEQIVTAVRTASGPAAEPVEFGPEDHAAAAALIRERLDRSLRPRPRSSARGLEFDTPDAAPETTLSHDGTTVLTRYRGRFVIYAPDRADARKRVGYSAIYFDAAALDDDER